MATKRKTSYVFVVPTRYYTPKRLAEIYGLDVKVISKNAIIAGAMYQIGAKKLINRQRLEKFLLDMGDFTFQMEGKYIQLNEAVKEFGIEEKKIMQFASDAEALIKIGNEVLINGEKLEKYIDSCKASMDLIDPDEDVDYRLKDYRRSRDLCLR